jgi:hypothetical protein
MDINDGLVLMIKQALLERALVMGWGRPGNARQIG